MKRHHLILVLSLLCLALTVGVVTVVALSSANDDYTETPAQGEGVALDKLSDTESDESFVWPDPTYQEMTTVPEDYDPGTLTITDNGDNTVTITCTVDGELVSHTVPADYNYTSGGFVGTDDVDRDLYTSLDYEMEAIDADQERYVGLFYFILHGEGNDNGLYNLQKILDENIPEWFTKAHTSELYGGVGVAHWFAEPLYGYYYISDEWVMRKHAELLTNANVDFLYFDVTNGYTYLHNAKKMMKILHELNEQGYDAPQIVFYTNSGSSGVVSSLYTQIYQANVYPDTWFCIDGKPVIVATERSDSIRTSGPISDTIKNFFTMKESQWPTEAKQTNAWPWIDFTWPQTVHKDNEGKPSAVNVSIAQHNGTVAFSDSSHAAGYKQEYSNRGRSYGSTAAQIARYNGTNAKAYKNAYNKDDSMTDYGYNFQAQWDFAINSEAEFILVTGWNEWLAERQEGITHRGDREWPLFIDCSSMEYSRDAEMMKGGYFDNYYMQLVMNIERLKGDAPAVVQDGRKPINVTGSFDQWDDVAVTYHDPTSDALDRNHKGFGNQRYTNDTGRNDIVASKITNDTKNLYFYVETVDTITKYDSESSWMQLFIDVDDSRDTGWYGFDYIINYKASDAFTTTVAKYTGTNGKRFKFETIGEIRYRASGNQMMIEVPMELLGIEDYDKINMQFKWADSDSTLNTMEKFYTDGDAAPLGRLNYVYQTYGTRGTEPTNPPLVPAETEPATTETSATPDVPDSEPLSTDDLTESADEEPTTEPVASTEASSGESTESEPADETTTAAATPDTTASASGCGSVITSAALITLMAAGVTAVCIRKKKD